jgi:serine/threonine protein kinase
MDRPTRELLAEYVLEWEDGFLAGRDIPAKELARDHPDLIEPLARRIRVLKATSWIDDPSDDIPGEAESPPPGGRVLGGRYRLDERIAVGGFAEVWKAFDGELRRVVAVKIPKATRIALKDAFMAEARRVARLRHPSIVAVHDVGIDGDDCFIVSDYMDGGSLADRIAAGPVDHRLALRWVAQIADALDYAHRNGVIHRDVKPANILINHHGDAALADFGIAQSATKSGEFAPSMGTLRYMAPEQFQGGPIGSAADIFSLGIVLHEAICGRTPHAGASPSDIRREVERSKDLAPSPMMPRPLAAVCRRAIRHDATRRHPDASAFAADVRRTSTLRGRVSAPLAVSAAGIAIAFAVLTFTTKRREASAPVAAIARSESTSVAAPPIPPAAIATSGDSNTASLLFTRIDHSLEQLVVVTNMRLFREWQDPPETYLGPGVNDVEGTATYRFDFVRPSRHLHLIAASSCWDFTTRDGGVGRGASAIDISRDGRRWISLADHITNEEWGTEWRIESPLPATVVGGTSLWVRVRLFTEDSPNTAYSVAQFGRNKDDSSRTVFGVVAELEPDAVQVTPPRTD